MKKSFRQIILVALGINLVILIGTIGFMITEDISFFSALWLTVISVLTVGYGDLTPQTKQGQVFALIIIPIGVGLVTYTLGLVAATIIEGKFSETVWRTRMDNQIKKLHHHVIVCGLGRVGQQVVNQLLNRNIDVVVIEKNQENMESAKENLLYIIGDATEDEILYEAGIEKASGLIITLPDDSQNVFITLSAKGVNPNIHVVSRASKVESEEKLRRAGADRVINPSSIGGRRIAMSILKPHSVEYVDTILQARNDDFSIEEMMIEADSQLVNKTLKESNIRKNFGVTVVGIKRNETIIRNPKPSETLRANDLVIIFGNTQELENFEKVAHG